jgi:hypothetical protein
LHHGALLDPNAHAAELCNEGVRVGAIRKTETRVFHDSEHMASSIWRLTVLPRVAEFVHFAHAIGRVDFDRDLVGKIAINLSLRNLTFASDHRRQEVKSEARNGPLTAQAATTRATRYINPAQRIPKRRCRFVVSLQECEPPSMWANTSLDGGKSLVSAATEVFAETISTTFTNPIRVIVEQWVCRRRQQPSPSINQRY